MKIISVYKVLVGDDEDDELLAQNQARLERTLKTTGMQFALVEVRELEGPDLDEFPQLSYNGQTIAEILEELDPLHEED